MKRKISFSCILLFWFTLIQAATISTNKTKYVPGEIITVSFGSAKAKTDWIGMYKSTITPGIQNSLAWQYLNGEQKVPSEIIESGTLVFTAPVTEGSYKMFFHPNDGYSVLASADFVVTTVEVAPVAKFYGSPFSVLPGGTINFTDQSLYSPVSWSWSFPGGIPSGSSDQNPSVKYNTAGTYSVTLTVTNSNGSNQLIRTGYITVSDSAGKATDVKFMSLNTWLEGTSVPNGITYIRDIIASVNPDIVCLVEVENYSGDWTTKLANELSAIGLYYYTAHINGSDASILSKFPVTSLGPLLKSATSIFNVDINGKSIVVAASHLDYLYYACYLPRGYKCGGSPPYNGWTQIGSPDPQPVTDLAIISKQNLGSQRDEQIGAFLDYVAGETRPVVILGDFNEPSFEDWTSRQAGLFDHNGVVYQWNTTFSLKSNNFTDAFRQVYPDEVLNPGITWPSFATGVGSTSWTPKSDERERIDYIFYRGTGIKTVNAAIIGPRDSYVKNVLSDANTENDHFLAETLPWPSDHKGVYALLTILAATDTNSVSISNSILNLPLKIKIYPNPGSEVLQLIATDNVSALINLTDMTGKQVFNLKMELVSNQVNSLDISNIPAGIYLLNVVSRYNSQTLKFIKN